MRIWVGSVLGAMGPREQINDFAQNQFLRMSSRLKHLGDLFNPSRAGISEAVVPPTSNVIGKSAADLRLRKERGISLLAINRDKQVIREDVRDVQLRAGDMLVFHSIWTDLAQAAKSRDFVVVTDYPTGEQRPHKFKIAMAIFALTILIALTSKLPVALTLMTGVAGMLLTGVLRMDEAYASINWKTVFMMAGLIPLGWAMDSSGAAAWVAGHTIDKLPTGIPVWVLEVALALLTTAFSLVISHVGATIVMVPIAVNLALAAGGNPTAFALIVALSASNNLMTASNPVISMITGPANYTPREMWRTVVADLYVRGGADDQPDVLSVGLLAGLRPAPAEAEATAKACISWDGRFPRSARTASCIALVGVDLGRHGRSTPCVDGSLDTC